MGECVITRRGGGGYKLPVLSPSLPQDVSVAAAIGASANFSISIQTPGAPAEYTYQWYMNGTLVSGQNGTTCKITGLVTQRKHTIYCRVTNKAGSVDSRTAIINVLSYLPQYTYTGKHLLIDDGNYNWRIKLLSSGNINFTTLGAKNSVDVFLVGGGGGGSNTGGYNSVGGGGGGYTFTKKAQVLSLNTSYPITIGAGGGAQLNGGTTSAFNLNATGGYGSTSPNGGNGGAGGGGGGGNWDNNDTGTGGTGGSDGGNGTGGSGTGFAGSGGTGQGTTTREFGEPGGTLYAGGGGGYGKQHPGPGGDGGGGTGAGGSSGGMNGTENTGGGGGGRPSWMGGGMSGGSGIIVIRNQRG